MQRRREEWEPMRQWLRSRFKEDWDDMWLHAEGFADAAGEANPVDPTTGIFLPMCLGQQLEIQRLEDLVEEQGDA